MEHDEFMKHVTDLEAERDEARQLVAQLNAEAKLMSEVLAFERRKIDGLLRREEELKSALEQEKENRCIGCGDECSVVCPDCTIYG